MQVTQFNNLKSKRADESHQKSSQQSHVFVVVKRDQMGLEGVAPSSILKNIWRSGLELQKFESADVLVKRRR